LTQYPFGVDGDIQASRFAQQYNSDLANDLGNLVSRVGKLVQTNFDGRVPKPASGIDGLDELVANAEALPGTTYEYIKQFQLTQAIAESMRLVRQANKFFNDTTPWILARNGQTEKLGGILYACLEVMRIVSVTLYPILPRKMRELRSLLGLTDVTLNLDSARKFFELQPGAPVNISQVIFPRIEVVDKKVAGDEKSPAKCESREGVVDIAEFGRLELLVAQVLQAERVEGANRLLKLQIDLGREKRQIVAGIAEFYSPEEITGRKIIVVANLKPTTIRGIESNGMLLAAKKGNQLSIVTVDRDLPPGAKVS
jgi:methionyl-tRNA synthetase